jgi:hypothetical protein
MRSVSIALSFFIFLICLGSCASQRSLRNTNIDQLYEQAIQDAMYAKPSEIDTNLVAVSSQNLHLKTKMFGDTECVLVVAWQGGKYDYPDSGYYKVSPTRYIWVTTSPELAERMSNETMPDKDMRLRQLLGLPPNKINHFFMEFYVSENDLFRPCPDQEINDHQCNLCFTKKDSSDQNHINWINNTRIYNYFGCDLYSKYPWTALGYTYDWNPKNKSHRGLSEFVVKPNSILRITRIVSTADYLQAR